MQQILVPIFVCCVMPVAIVFIIFFYKMNADRHRSEIIIKSIESNNSIDVDKLTESLGKRIRNPLEILNLRLLRGCIFTLVGAVCIVLSILYNQDEGDSGFGSMMMGFVSLAIGISYLLVYFLTRRQAVDVGKPASGLKRSEEDKEDM